LTLPEGLDRLGDEVGRLRDWPNREDFSFVFGANRRIGIGVSQLTKQLGEYFGVPGGRGALVTSVKEGGPAARAGMKAGDVITAIDGKTVERLSDLTRELNRKGDGEVTLKIIRDKSERTIRLTPERGADFDFEPEINAAPQVGQLSLPRLAVPVIPAIRIKAMPKIVLPALPKLDKIVMPSLPAVRIQRAWMGPL
jgi:membrane-associated protease RseP (regulator of RpoE activity)